MTTKTDSTPWWYRQVPRDFMSSPDVTIMTAEECGSFFFLLQHAWLSGDDCTLPNDPARLAKLARVDKVADIVLQKFETDKQGRLFNPRLSVEWQEALKRTKDARKNANKRWNGDMPPHSDGNTGVLPPKFEGNAKNKNNNKHKKETTKTMQAQVGVSSSSSTEVSGQLPNPAQPTEAGVRVAQKLIEVLGRSNLKPTTMTAWAYQADALLTKHPEATITAVIQWALVDSPNMFWRGRVYAMKNLVRAFTTIVGQYEKRDQKPGAKAPADALAERAASLHTGHDFSALAKGNF